MDPGRLTGCREDRVDYAMVTASTSQHPARRANAIFDKMLLFASPFSGGVAIIAPSARSCSICGCGDSLLVASNPSATNGTGLSLIATIPFLDKSIRTGGPGVDQLDSSLTVVGDLRKQPDPIRRYAVANIRTRPRRACRRGPGRRRPNEKELPQVSRRKAGP